jgi:putative hemolysin
MSKFSLLVIAATMVLSLNACSGEPWTLARSSDHITLRWWSDDMADAQAAGTASAYCAQVGRSFETIAIERDGSASIGHYRCI